MTNSVEQNLALHFQLTLQKMTTDFNGMSDLIVYQSMIQAFAKTNKALKKECSAPFCETGVSGIFVFQGKIWPFNQGESRICLWNKGASSKLNHALTEELDFESHLQQTSALPGAISTQSHPVSSRADSLPTIYPPFPLHDLSADHFITITSGGINCVANPLKLLKELRQQKNGSLIDPACNIVYSAIQAGATESCTAIVIQLYRT